MKKKIEFYKHNINNTDIKLLMEVLHSIILTTGPKTGNFENLLADYLNLKHCVGVSSWTTGAFMALKSWGIGEGDEVIVPAMTFIATANVVLHCQARPVLVDVEADTGLIGVKEIEDAITPRTKAIIPVHLYGQMADMRAIRRIADNHNLKILEDAAHCIEGERDGVRPGELSDAVAFSFYSTKNIASGEGGAVVTNDTALADNLRILRSHGMDKSAADRYVKQYRHWDMVMLGYKANLFDIQAALLINQLKRIDKMWKKKNEISKNYEKAFAGKIDFPKTLPGVKHARHLFTIWTKNDNRDEVISEFENNKIGVAVNYRPVHLLKYYRDKFGYKEGDLPNAEEIGRRTISIPLYPKLSVKEVDYIIKITKALVA